MTATLRHGDRVRRDEFERRWDATPDVKKAELIDGVVMVGGRVPFVGHAEPHANLVTWLGLYHAHTPGTEAASGCTLRINDLNEPLPDAVLLIDQSRGGGTRVDDDDILAGAPELVAEVISGREPYDEGVKVPLYRRTGVRECLVWRTQDTVIDWYVLRGDSYEPLPAGADGVTRSEAFPGLWLDASAMVSGDVARVHDVLRQGLATPEHAAFAAKLRAAGGGGP